MEIVWYCRRPDVRQSLPKRPRLEEPSSSKRIPKSDSKESSNPEDERKIEGDISSNAGARRSKKVIPLIPLLKVLTSIVFRIIKLSMPGSC